MNKLNIVLFVLAVLSALAVVSVQDSSRESFITLEKEHQRRDLEEEYRRLQWQQAKLANHGFIKAAAEQQQLQPPTMQNTKIVRLQY